MRGGTEERYRPESLGRCGNGNGKRPQETGVAAPGLRRP